MPSATKGKLFIKSFPLESFQKFFNYFFRGDTLVAYKQGCYFVRLKGHLLEKNG
jgi:hypothetical protein